MQSSLAELDGLTHSARRHGHGVFADQMRAQGEWLFRWRSFLPLLLLPMLAYGLLSFHYCFGSHVADVIEEAILLPIAFAGLALRVVTVGFVPKGTSGRNTKQMKAAALNTSGIYSTVRHPLYLANFLIFIAPVIHIGNAFLVAFATVAYWFYYERIMVSEESFLLTRYGEAYLAWARRTPAVVPSFRYWQTPSLAFSWRSALKREYTTFFLIICMFMAVEVVGDYVVHRHLVFEMPWCILFGVGLVTYLGVRVVKKSTTLLDVVGR